VKRNWFRSSADDTGRSLDIGSWRRSSSRLTRSVRSCTQATFAGSVTLM
jgi:hypothetical protein